MIVARRRCAGFTLLEILAAFAFVAIATVAVLAAVRSNLRLLSATQDLAMAAQASAAPDLGVKELGVRTRKIRESEIEMGPLTIRSVEIEIIPPERADGVRMKLYQ